MPEQKWCTLKFHADGGLGWCVCASVNCAKRQVCPRMVLGEDRRRLQVMSASSRMCFLCADKRWASERFQAFTNSHLICLLPSFCFSPSFSPHLTPSTWLRYKERLTLFRSFHRSATPSLVRSGNSSSTLPNYWRLVCDRCKRDGWKWRHHRLTGTSVRWPLGSKALANCGNIQTHLLPEQNIRSGGWKVTGYI